MGMAEEDASHYLTTLYVIVIGAGIGLIQPCITMTVQNAVEMRDLGIATSGTLLFRMIGGAFGATMVGAILVGRFNALMGTHARLSTLRSGLAAGSGHALASGFHFAFLGCAAMSILGFAIALMARDPVLRTNAPLAPQAE